MKISVDTKPRSPAGSDLETSTATINKDKLSMPKLQATKDNLALDDSALNVKHKANGQISLNIPRGSGVILKYKRQTDTNSTGASTINFDSSTTNFQGLGISISRNEDTITINTNKNTIALTAQTFNKDSVLVETDLLSSSAKAVKPTKPLQQIKDFSLKSKGYNSSGLDSSANISTDTNVIKCDSLSNLQNQAEKLDLPNNVALTAYKHKLSNLSKVEVKDNNYVHCDGDACTVLGKVKTIETSKQANTLDLNKISAGTKIDYSYNSAQGRVTGSIAMPELNSNITSVSMSGIGTFTKNADNTFSFKKDANFSGSISSDGINTFSLKATSKGIESVKNTAKPIENTISNRLSKPAPSRSYSEASKILEEAPAASRKSNIIYMDGNSAHAFMKSNPEKEIVAIATAHFHCPPCESLKGNLATVAMSSPDTTYVMIDPHNRGGWNVKSFPSTFVKPAGTDSITSESYNATKQRFRY